MFLGLRRNFPHNLRGFKANFSSNLSKIVNVEEKRNLIKPEERDKVDESFLPPADFPYSYEPMSIFEEKLGTYLKELNYKISN